MHSADQFHMHCGLRFLEKAGPDGPRKCIAGVITTDRRDRQGEIIEQDGLDFSEFLNNGFFNSNHGKSGSHVLGWPNKRSLTKFRPGQTLPDGSQAPPRNGHWIEGYLIPGDPEAEAIWAKGKALQAAKSDRNIGFSIEGQALARDPTNPKRITRALVRHVAITPSPVNTDTNLLAKGEIDHIAKSLLGIDMHGIKKMKGESDDHYGMRMSFKKNHPAEQYNAVFSGFLAKSEPEEDDEGEDWDEEDVEKAIAVYEGAPEVSPAELEKAIEQLQETLGETAPTARRDELIKGAAVGTLSADEAAELASLASGGRESSFGDVVGDSLSKSLDGVDLDSLMDGVTNAVVLLGERLEKSDSNRHAFERDVADVVIGQAELIKGLVKGQQEILQALQGQAGMPVRAPGVGWPSGVPTPGQLGNGATGAMAKGLDAPYQQPPQTAGGRDTRVMDLLEEMAMRSNAGQYGPSPDMAHCGESLTKGLTAYETDGTISEGLAAEVTQYAQNRK